MWLLTWSNSSHQQDISSEELWKKITYIHQTLMGNLTLHSVRCLYYKWRADVNASVLRPCLFSPATGNEIKNDWKASEVKSFHYGTASVIVVPVEPSRTVEKWILPNGREAAPEHSCVLSNNKEKTIFPSGSTSCQHKRGQCCCFLLL